MDILWLDQPACQDRNLVGGKAAQLSRLAAHYQVPPGFCVTTTAFTHAFEGSASLDNSGLLPPAHLYDQLDNAYQILGERCGIPEASVAVRSSAVAEDGHTASFAGQFETFLNLIGVKAVAQAVGRCWSAAASERVLAYRRRQGMAGGDLRLAVLVQQLVAADVSAVVFSANPITGSRDEIVINASWGLGETVVGGRVTPDTYLLRKADLTLLSRQVTEKARMTVPVSGGIREVDVPRFLRHQPSLDESQVIEMARLALNLETQLGWPVDVECAYQGGQLYLLQCRPITSPLAA